MAERKVEAYWVEARQRWQINIQKDGERKTFTCSTSGKKGKIACEKKADKWLEGRSQKDVRMRVAWDEFIEESKTLTSSGTYKQRETLGRLWILPDLQHKRLGLITNQDWQNCINSVFKKGLSKKSCSNVRGVITVFAKYCRKAGYDMVRPEDLVVPKAAPSKEKTILQPEDVRTLFSKDSIMHRNRAYPCFYIHAWRFAVLTGLRPGEIAGLRREDIDGGLLSIRRAINNDREKTDGKNANARRQIILSRLALDELDAQYALLRQKGIVTPWVFPSPKGDCQNPRASYKQWLTYRKQHGITCSPYELRHTMVSLTKNKLPNSMLKRIVGHSATMDTLGVYGHDVDGELEEAAGILDDVFAGILNSEK